MKYFLMEACQNTFVLFDCMNRKYLNDCIMRDINKALQFEEVDDALILIQGRAVEGHFFAKMLVLGLDGAFGEFCGNGARSCASYLFKKFPEFKRFSLITEQGNHELLKHENQIYSVTLPYPSFDLNQKFLLRRDPFELTYVECIEPHLTIQKIMSDHELLALGKWLNSQKDVFPLGINVNAWIEIENNVLFVKTYERGVQRLTKSCGTGSICCCICYKKKGDFDVLTPGGKLQITLGEKHATLKGPASFSYRGRTKTQG